MKELYEIEIGTAEWYNAGGGTMVAVARCWAYGVDAERLTNDDAFWLGMSEDSFVVYNEYPFGEEYYDEMVEEIYNLNDCHVTANHGTAYDFGEWQKVGDAMLNLYNFYDNSKGVMN